MTYIPNEGITGILISYGINSFLTDFIKIFAILDTFLTSGYIVAKSDIILIKCYYLRC
jgi:hypothetical protein